MPSDGSGLRRPDMAGSSGGGGGGKGKERAIDRGGGGGAEDLASAHPHEPGDPNAPVLTLQVSRNTSRTVPFHGPERAHGAPHTAPHTTRSLLVSFPTRSTHPSHIGPPAYLPFFLPGPGG